MRPFQFSLRTLLIAVTLLAIGCGYVTWRTKKTVAERKAMIVQIREIGGFVRLTSEVKTGKPPATVPFIRKLLGDEPVEMIFIPADLTVAVKPPGLSMREVQEVFPEAQVYANESDKS